MSNILITSAGKRVSLVRAFQQELKLLLPNSLVFTADANPLMSAACHVSDGNFVLPRVNAPNYIEVLTEVVIENNIKLIIPTIDTELLLLSEYKISFKSLGVDVLISDNHWIQILRDKRKTHDFFKAFGIDVAKEFEKTLFSLPLYIKPIDGSRSVDNFIVKNEEELLDYHFKNDKLMFLEYIDHQQHKEFTIDLYYDKKSNLRCMVPRERAEVRDGEVSKAITRDLSIWPDLWCKMQTIKGFFGCITLQVFINNITNRVIGIEINPRFGGGYPLTYIAGGNFPKWIVEEYFLQKEIEDFFDWKKNMLMLRYDHEVIIENYTNE